VSDILGTLGRFLGAVFAVAVTHVTNVVKVLTGVWQVAGKVIEVVIKIFTMAANVVKGVLTLAFDVLMNKLGPISTALRAVATGVRTAFTSIANVISAAFRGVTGAVESVINFAIDGINMLIRAYNKLADFLPGVSRATEIAAFKFSGLASATVDVSKGAAMAASTTDGWATSAGRATMATKTSTDSLGSLNTAAGLAAGGVGDLAGALGGGGGGGAGGKSVADSADKATEKLEKFKAKFTEVADSLKAKTKEIQDAYDGVITSVQGVVMGAFDTSNIDPSRIGENGEAVGGTWLDGLASQAAKAVGFANKVAEVVKLGLQPGSAAFETVMGVTKQQGTGLLDELIAGGVEAVNKSVEIVDSVTGAALRVGTEAADQFFGTGLTLAKQTEDAFAKRFGEGGPGYNKLNRMMSQLAASLDRTSTITVVTRHVSEGIPGRRFGGPVAAGSPYIVGEAGPELFVPTMTGQIIPNHDITGSMTGGGGVSMGAGGSTINLTVNAGMGTQGAEVGRQIVDALKAYERRNGSVYVAA
jgi:hypothetical protein